MPKQAVVLLSGGVDSTTCLAIAKSQGFDCYTLAFDYGQKNRSELIAAEKIAHHFAVKKHLVFTLPIAQFGCSALTDNSIAVPDYEGSETILATYVPARNTIFLAVALGYAETLQANDIFIGVSQVDHSGYPDCRPDYFAAYANLANLATKTGVEGNKLTIHTPIIELSKAETISLGTQLGIDYAMTVSCYRADQDGRACGNCDSCTLRKLGYAEAGLVDNTKYL